jgi:hypothetical protein
MRRITSALVISIVLVLMAGASVIAQQADPPDPTKSEEQAMAVLKRMADFIAKAKSFSVTIDAGFDAVQESGSEDRIRRDAQGRAPPAESFPR